MMTNSAPFRSSAKFVKPEWIDYNGHLNMAYYSVLFDTGVDEIYAEIGFGPDYIKTHGHTTYTAEFHICYIRELHQGDETYVTTQLIDFDEKRFHTYQELHHADGWLAATGEAMALHIDMSGPRVAPMPPHILARIQALHTAHATLPKPTRLSKSIGIKRTAKQPPRT
jgi:acyl-CoA thioester hydrolase